MKLPILKLAAASLAFFFNLPALAQTPTPAPTPEKPIDFSDVAKPADVKYVYWEQGKEYCDEIYIDGTRIRYLTDGGVTVALFVADVDGFYAAAVRVENRTEARVLVDPDRTRFMVIAKNEKDDFPMKPLDPDKVAKKIAGRAKWGNFWRSFAAGMATRTTTSQSQESGSFNVYGPRTSANGTYSGSSTTTTTAPDYSARDRAAEANARASAEARGEAELTRGNALRTTTLFPAHYVNGSIFFEHKKIERAVFRIMIGQTVYNFPVRFK